MRAVARFPFRRLEQEIGLDSLPEFHRAFLARHRPDRKFGRIRLREMQGIVERVLDQFLRDRVAISEGQEIWVVEDAIPEEYRARHANLAADDLG
jgi:hypothetical protein